jgi:2-keto-4-pentenoate hydratase/2-oxohepta-3-ene-1,7-dioic acid hydratase in catechol pathway
LRREGGGIVKIAIFNDDLLGVVMGDRVTDVSKVAGWDKADPNSSFLKLVENFNELKEEMNREAETGTSYSLNEVTLKSPVPSTRKIWAAPVNYRKHQEEMNEIFNNAPRTIEEIALFLKSPESLSGPSDPILLPYKDRRTDHEAGLDMWSVKRRKI